MTTARDILRELHDKAVGVRDVQCPVSPWPVGGAAEDGGAQVPEPAGLGVDVLDHEDDLGRRAGRGPAVGQPVGATLLVSANLMASVANSA